jgi:hypothetical protein
VVRPKDRDRRTHHDQDRHHSASNIAAGSSSTWSPHATIAPPSAAFS